MPAPELPHQKVGPYLLRARLGNGGMGEVFRGFDPRLKRPVALKRIRTDKAEGRLSRARFRREARTAASLSHQGIVKILDILDHGDADWIVMEFVEGQTLARHLETGQPEIEVAMGIAVRLAEALGAAHEQGIVHRDLKTSNILVAQDRQIKILDFGLAKQVMEAQGSTALSTDGEVVGTPHAMSPEQAMGRPVDLRSDLFSLGALYYELFAGKSPFKSNSLAETLIKICSYDPPPLDDLVPEIPQALSQLVAELLQKDPSRRPTGTAHVVDTLLRSTPASGPACLRRRRWVGEHPETDRGSGATLNEDSPTISPQEAEPRIQVEETSHERRPVTVLCCDLVSRVPSTKVDPELLLEASSVLSQATRQVMVDLGGHLASQLGHRIVAYFGYPHIYEDAARRAVLSAQQLRRHFDSLDPESPFTTRCGIHAGLALVAANESRASRSEGSDPIALGSILDLALSLNRRASPGQVLISSELQPLLAHDFSLQSLGRQTMDPVGPIEVLRVQSLSKSKPPVKRPLPALVARDSQLAALQQAWQHASKGQGRLVLISGEAGIGKTRLVTSFIEANQDIQWFQIQGMAHRQSSPWAPVVTWLRDVVEMSEDGGDDSQGLEHLKAQLEDLALPNGHGPEGERLYLLASLLDLPTPPLNLSPEAQKRKTHEALLSLVLAISRQQPLVMVVEDLHWLDASTLQLLSLWLEFTDLASVLWIFTFREDFRLPFSIPADATSLPLQRLAAEASAGLIASLNTRRPLPPQLVQDIIARADGVPLFIEEIVNCLRESNALGSRDVACSTEALEIPASLRGSLMARLDRLGDAKPIAQWASIIGREFSFHVLQAVMDRPVSRLERALESLLTAGLIEKRGFARRRRYWFRHALIADTAYDSLLPSERRSRHQHVARTLERGFEAMVRKHPETLAHHWHRGEQPNQAVPYYLRAGDQARDHFANDEALSFYQHALQLSRGRDFDAQDSNHPAPEIAERLGDLMTLMGRSDDASDTYAKSLDWVQDGLVQARLHRKIGRAWDRKDCHTESLTALRRARNLLDVECSKTPCHAAKSEYIEILLVEASTYYRQGDGQRLKQTVDVLEPMAAEHGTSLQRAALWETRIMHRLRTERYLLHAEDAKPEGFAYLEACLETGLKERIADGHLTLAMVLLFSHQLEEALSQMHLAVQQTLEIGAPFIHTLALAYLALIYRRLGDVSATRKACQDLLSWTERPEYRRPEYIGLAKGNLAWVEWKEGRQEACWKYSEQAFANWRESDMCFPFQWTAALPRLTLSKMDEPQRQAALVSSLLHPSQARLPSGIARCLTTGPDSTPRAEELSLATLRREAEQLGYL